MMTKLSKSNFLWFFLSLVILLAGCRTPTSQAQVCFKDNCLDVEVSWNLADRMRGLQFRHSLGANRGMLFIFPEERKYSFWMKDTKIPLDIIWMDSSRRVIHVESNVLPCAKDPCPTYIPKKEALYVLEINAGHAGRMGFKEGDRLEFRHIGL